MNLKHRKQLNHLLTENWKKKNVNTQVVHEIRLLYEIDYNMIWQMNIICWKLLASWLVGRIFSLVKVIVCPITSKKKSYCFSRLSLSALIKKDSKVMASSSAT